MKSRYLYRVNALSADGSAIVEYNHPSLGKVMKHMILPYDKGHAGVHQKILEEFPRDMFYSNKLTRDESTVPEVPIYGEIEIDLDDHFYDIMSDFDEEKPEEV